MVNDDIHGLLVWKCLTDCLHHQERLRKRGEGSSMGTRSEDSTWTSTTREFWYFQREEQLQGTLWDCRAGQEKSRSCKVSSYTYTIILITIYIPYKDWFDSIYTYHLQASRAAHTERTCWVCGEAKRFGHWYYPAALHCVRSSVKL